MENKMEECWKHVGEKGHIWIKLNGLGCVWKSC